MINADKDVFVEVELGVSGLSSPSDFEGMGEEMCVNICPSHYSHVRNRFVSLGVAAINTLEAGQGGWTGTSLCRLLSISRVLVLFSVVAASAGVCAHTLYWLSYVLLAFLVFFFLQTQRRDCSLILL